MASIEFFEEQSNRAKRCSVSVEADICKLGSTPYFLNVEGLDESDDQGNVIPACPKTHIYLSTDEAKALRDRLDWLLGGWRDE